MEKNAVKFKVGNEYSHNGGKIKILSRNIVKGESEDYVCVRFILNGEEEMERNVGYYYIGKNWMYESIELDFGDKYYYFTSCSLSFD